MRISQRHRGGFTSFAAAFSLTELLVVIVVIVLLIALLIPAVTSVHRRMMVTQCASNLRQLGQTLINYQTSNRGALPLAQPMPPPYASTDRSFANAPNLYDALKSLLPINSGIYRCPADEYVYPRCAALSQKHLGLSYLYLDVSKIHHRTASILMWDYMGSTFLPSGASALGIPFAHPGEKVNWLFVDGHVEFRGNHSISVNE